MSFSKAVTFNFRSILFLFLFVSLESKCLHIDDYNFLDSLYIQNGGSSWIWKEKNVSKHWVFGPYNDSSYPDPCYAEFEGVICSEDSTGCRLITLKLHDYGISGLLTDSFHLPQNLSSLDLSKTLIVGPIPSTL